MAYQGVVLPILLGVGLCMAAVLYFISQRDSPSPHSNRSRNNGGQSYPESTPAWELGSDRSSKPKRKRSVQAEQTTCAICFEELKGDFKILSCQHKFHVGCIDRWFREQQNCPVCRRCTTQ